MGTINSNINAYVNTMNYRTGRNFNHDNSNIKQQQSNIALNTKNSNSPDELKSEGQTDKTTKIPPPNEIGKIMDFKI